MLKMICIDLDGTLLNSNNEVSDANKKAIIYALNKGIKVMLVSGRPNCFASRIASNIDKRIGIITFNGGYYRIDDQEYYFPIDEKVVRHLAQIAMEDNVRTFIKNRNTSICNKDDPHTLDYDKYRDQTAKEDQMDLYYNVDFNDYLAKHQINALKLLTWDGGYEQMEEIAKTYPQIKVFSHEHYFEICNAQTDKGMAIEQVCTNEHIALKDVMCIGDGDNDKVMFAIAGISVAMGNASESVKESCDYITDTNDNDGVSKAIMQFA